MVVAKLRLPPILSMHLLFLTSPRSPASGIVSFIAGPNVGQTTRHPSSAQLTMATAAGLSLDDGQFNDVATISVVTPSGEHETVDLRASSDSGNASDENTPKSGGSMRRLQSQNRMAKHMFKMRTSQGDAGFHHGESAQPGVFSAGRASMTMDEPATPNRNTTKAFDEGTHIEEAKTLLLSQLPN